MKIFALNCGFPSAPKLAHALISLGIILPSRLAIFIPLPRKLPIAPCSRFGIALGCIGVPQKFIIFAMLAASCITALILSSVLLILV